MSVTPLSASELLSALRVEGVRCVEYKSWRTHNRDHKGAFGPVNGVMLHHTVTSGTDSSVELCYSGHSALPGPLCHGVIAKDGTVHLVGHGRANHAGRGDGDVLRAVVDERDLPPDDQADTDGNARFYGFEAVNLGDGKDLWPAAQVEAMVRASAAILRAHGWGTGGDTSVIGHREWQPGKVDPRPSPGGADVRMGVIRARVAERLRHPADWNENEEDEMDADEVYEAVMETPAMYMPYEDGKRTFRQVMSGVGKRVYSNEQLLRSMSARLAAQQAALDRLVDAVGELAGAAEVDLAELREGVRSAIREGVEGLAVDFTIADDETEG